MKNRGIFVVKTHIKKKLYFLNAILAFFLVALWFFIWFFSQTVFLNPPTPPTNVILSWTDNSNNEDGFIAQRSTDLSFTSPTTVCDVDANVLTCSGGLLSSLLSSTVYYFRVQAYVNSPTGPIYSAWSDIASVTTPSLPICTIGEIGACSYSGSAETLGVGVCVAGTRNCIDDGAGSGVWGTCSGEVTPSAEICDNYDNNCDGQIDNGLGTLSCGVGACSNTFPVCLGGVDQICTPLSPSIEQCIDGVDNDCNGLTDCLDLLSCSANSACVTQICGDGILQIGEQCDDGNLIDDDGCSSCVVDNGYTCNSAVPNVCSPLSFCGDGT